MMGNLLCAAAGLEEIYDGLMSSARQREGLLALSRVFRVVENRLALTRQLWVW
jgi:hypothetical protein